MGENVAIPNKSHFKMEEVCGITGIKPYVLRFWESEFDEINPLTSSTGTKLFSHKDIDAILMVKKLLFEDKMTVEQVLKEIEPMGFRLRKKLDFLPWQHIFIFEKAN